MKKYFLLLCLFAVTGLQAQYDAITLRFTANYNCSHSSLDSILIENLDQGGSKVLYYPDTVFTITTTGIDIPGNNNNDLIIRNYPNPFSEKTDIDIYAPSDGLYYINIFDLSGRKVATTNAFLERGYHQFIFQAGYQQAYLLTVSSQKHIQKLLMIQAGNVGFSSQITYVGMLTEARTEKSFLPKSAFPFEPGDELKFTGYVTDFSDNVDYAIISDTPEDDQDYLFDIENTEPEQPSEISGKETVFNDETGLVYQVDQVPGVIYHWTVPDDWDITDGQGTYLITATSGFESGDIVVQAENGCGLSSERVLSVNVTTKTYEVHFIDVGQGDAILVITPEKVLLVDAGWNNGKAANYLSRLEIEQIDIAIASHPHADHIGGFIEIFETFEVGEVIDNGVTHTTQTYNNYLTAIDENDIPYTVGRKGMERSLGENAYVQILHPPEPITSYSSNYLNNASVVAKVTLGDIELLLTGDIEQEGEADLMSGPVVLSSTILKVAHHGSNSSSTMNFLQAVEPEVSVIMCGLNNQYGHPHQPVLDRLNEIESAIYRTDLHGSIKIITDGVNYSVTTESQSKD